MKLPRGNRVLRALSPSGLTARLAIAAALTGMLIAACGKDSTAPAAPLASIVVTPSGSLAVNTTHQFVAVGKDANGNVVAITPVWSVVGSGGTISSTGLFTAGSVAGTFTNTVKATNGSSSGTATVTVTAGSLATITVTPGLVTLAANAPQQFTAVGKDAGGNVVAITPVWSVVASGGAISSTGMFTAGAVIGTFTNTVTATSGTISGTATVIVTAGSLATITVTPGPVTLPANAPQQFTAVGKDAGGNVVTITPVWSVVANGGTISSTGLFTAGAVAGTFTNTVKATNGSSSGTATVTVTMASVSHGPSAVTLGSAANYVILAKSGISNVPTSAITGDLGLSPAAASYITGFALTLPAAGAASTSAQVTGKVYAADYAVPTPNNLTVAILAMQAAYTDAAGRPTPDYTELATGAIGGLTLPPGLYKWSNTVTIGSDVTLTGNATDVWIFQIAGGVTQSAATHVILAGGALAANVFWQVAGIADIGTTAHIEGQIMSKTAITLHTGATANGRLMAQTAVTLAGNTVVKQ